MNLRDDMRMKLDAVKIIITSTHEMHFFLLFIIISHPINFNLKTERRCDNNILDFAVF